MSEAAIIFTLPEIAKATGAQYGTLKSWVDRGLFTPTVRDSTGTGNVCFYSERDLGLASLLVKLRRQGLGIDALAAVAADLKADVIWTCPVCRANHEFKESDHAQ